jgi:hypothetical protein
VIRTLYTFLFLATFIAELTLDSTTTFVRLNPNSQQTQLVDQDLPAPEDFFEESDRQTEKVLISVTTLTHSALPPQTVAKIFQTQYSFLFPLHPISKLNCRFTQSRIERPPIA